MGTSDNPFTWTVSYEMNHRDSTQPLAAARTALRTLSLLLLPTLAPHSADALPRSHSPAAAKSPAPYLPVIGAPHLRFLEAAPPPDLVARPPAAAPPQPALTPAENTVAADNATAARSVTTPETPAETTPPTDPIDPPAAAPSAESSGNSAPPILPDDARPQVRPEDFLPYFQIPGSAQKAGDVTLLVPAPFSAPTGAPLPPSSATYTQTPK